MMNTHIYSLLFIILIISSSWAYAERPIARCVNAQGELTFTDYLCTTEEPGHNPLLMSDSAINPSIKARIPSVVKAESIAQNTLRSATSEAQSQCEQRFNQYFRRKHPSTNSVPNVEFSQVVDQFMNGPNISISLTAPIRYDEKSYAISSNVECTVQRMRRDSDWVIGFRENQ